MKKLFILSLLALASITANAQTCMGYFTRNYENYRKGDPVDYQIRNGKVYIGDEDYCIQIPSNYVRFSGYYIGQIVDPRDNYVNVRKGPGTNYSVVMRIYTWSYIVNNELFDNNSMSYQLAFYFKKTSSNWYKLYSAPGEFIGYIYKDRIRYQDCPGI